MPRAEHGAELATQRARDAISGDSRRARARQEVDRQTNLQEANDSLLRSMQQVNGAFEQLRQSFVQGLVASERVTGHLQQQEGTVPRARRTVTVEHPGEQFRLLPETRPVGRLVNVNVENIEVQELEPTREMVESVRVLGVLQPVALVQIAAGVPRYRIAAGRRRVTAARQVGITSIPSIIFPPNTPVHVAAAMALTENTQRRPNPLTDLMAIERMVAEGATEQQISVALAIPVNVLRARMRLANLIPRLRQALEVGDLSPTMAEQAARLDRETQVRFADMAPVPGQGYTGPMLRQAREVQVGAQIEGIAADAFATPPALSEEAVSAATGGQSWNLRAERIELLDANGERIFVGNTNALTVHPPTISGGRPHVSGHVSTWEYEGRSGRRAEGQRPQVLAPNEGTVVGDLLIYGQNRFMRETSALAQIEQVRQEANRVESQLVRERDAARRQAIESSYAQAMLVIDGVDGPHEIRLLPLGGRPSRDRVSIEVGELMFAEPPVVQVGNSRVGASGVLAVNGQLMVTVEESALAAALPASLIGHVQGTTPSDEESEGGGPRREFISPTLLQQLRDVRVSATAAGHIARLLGGADVIDRAPATPQTFESVTVTLDEARGRESWTTVIGVIDALIEAAPAGGNDNADAFAVGVDRLRALARQLAADEQRLRGRMTQATAVADQTR